MLSVKSRAIGLHVGRFEKVVFGAWRGGPEFK